MVSASDGSAFTGSVTVSVTGDAGTQATGSVSSGACTHEGNGYHTYSPAQAETNYDLIAFTFTGTGAIPQTVQVFTTAQPKGTTTLATPTNITAGTITTVTNLTNAPTSGDLTATMKTSVTTAATAATPVAASVTGNVGGNVTGSVGSVATGGIAAASFAANAVNAAALAADAVTEIQSGLATAAALATVDGIVDDILVDTADMQPKLGTPAGLSISADIAAIEAQTDDIGAAGAGLTALATAASVAALNNLSAAQVNAEVVDALATDVISDSIPADGSRPTIAQALYLLTQFMTERAVSGTTMTVKKPDGSTTLATFTLGDATSPTSITRAS